MFMRYWLTYVKWNQIRYSSEPTCRFCHRKEAKLSCWSWNGKTSYVLNWINKLLRHNNDIALANRSYDIITKRVWLMHWLRYEPNDRRVYIDTMNAEMTDGLRWRCYHRSSILTHSLGIGNNTGGDPIVNQWWMFESIVEGLQRTPSLEVRVPSWCQSHHEITSGRPSDGYSWLLTKGSVAEISQSGLCQSVIKGPTLGLAPSFFKVFRISSPYPSYLITHHSHHPLTAHPSPKRHTPSARNAKRHRHRTRNANLGTKHLLAHVQPMWRMGCERPWCRCLGVH